MGQWHLTINDMFNEAESSRFQLTALTEVPQDESSPIGIKQREEEPREHKGRLLQTNRGIDRQIEQGMK